MNGEKAGGEKTLVTGGSGFIGRNLVGLLEGRNHQVTVLVRKVSDQFSPGIHQLVGDISDPYSLETITGSFDRAFHLGGFVTFQQSYLEKLIQINGEGTRNFLELANRLGIEKTVIVSSAATLGVSESPDQILDESVEPPGNLVRANPYLASKLVCENHARNFSKKIHVVTVLPTTVYGTGDHSCNSGSLILKVLRGKVLPVPPGGGNVVDVRDVCEGMCLAAEKGRTGERYILGGYNLTFIDIFRTILKADRKKSLLVPIPPVFKSAAILAAKTLGFVHENRFLTPQIVGDLFRFKFYSSEKSLRDLGWKATVPFVQSIREALLFYREKGLIKSGS